MKPVRTTIEGNLAACDHADAERVEQKESGEDRMTFPFYDTPTQTELHCQEHKQERFEKMLKNVYGFFRRKV